MSEINACWQLAVIRIFSGGPEVVVPLSLWWAAAAQVMRGTGTDEQSRAQTLALTLLPSTAGP